MADGIQILKDFVGNTISEKDFEQQLYTNPDLEKILSDPSITWQGTYLQDTNPFLFLAEQDYKSSVGKLNAHGAVKLFLSKIGVEFTSSTEYSDEYNLILSTSPKYIDADPDFIEKYILPEDKTLSKADQKLYMKQRYAHLFKYQTKPPQWIQNPNWPIKNDKPFFFLGQIDIKDCDLFHDNGCVYLFVDPETEAIETVKQFY
ncbi:hypothetical protein [Chryseobacterium sp. Bi04]|uniref:hypothetical protein n=1 Tax=Chryseobacterium sp. Bi04 TaxID=2822345 RepID=UPI001D8154F8|nr:hypothetical protein [Chryseobacterium sp. Bi04]CAH0188187.1 hypothetical protein SRABI04_01670 [Chryseobacterium sp. Bi04]